MPWLLLTNPTSTISKPCEHPPRRGRHGAANFGGRLSTRHRRGHRCHHPDIIGEFGADVAELVYWLIDAEEGNRESQTLMSSWRRARALSRRSSSSSPTLSTTRRASANTTASSSRFGPQKSSPSSGACWRPRAAVFQITRCSSGHGLQRQTDLRIRRTGFFHQPKNKARQFTPTALLLLHRSATQTSLCGRGHVLYDASVTPMDTNGGVGAHRVRKGCPRATSGSREIWIRALHNSLLRIGTPFAGGMEPRQRPL